MTGMRTPQTSKLAATAACGLGFFVLVIATLPLMQGDRYSAVRQAMSELYLERGGWLVPIAFCVMGIGTVALAVLLRQLTGAALAPKLFMIVAALDVVSAACHAVRYDQPMTTTGAVHIGAGIASFLLIIGGMFASVRPLRRLPGWERFGRTTRIWATVSVAAFVLLSPGIVGQAHFGLGQRVMAATFMSWMLTLSFKALLTSRPAATSAAQLRAAAGA